MQLEPNDALRHFIVYNNEPEDQHYTDGESTVSNDRWPNVIDGHLNHLGILEMQLATSPSSKLESINLLFQKLQTDNLEIIAADIKPEESEPLSLLNHGDNTEVESISNRQQLVSSIPALLILGFFLACTFKYLLLLACLIRLLLPFYVLLNILYNLTTANPQIKESFISLKSSVI